MKTSDIDQVIDIHLKSFTGFFLSFLGKSFLRELYRAIICDKSGISLVYEEESGITGFVAGIYNAAGFFRRILKKYWWRFGKAAVLPALRQPGIIPRLIRAFQKPDEYQEGEDHAVLLSIAVLPGQQGKGIGKALVEGFLRAVKNNRVEQVSLTTDKNNNEYVNSFYQRIGFRIKDCFVTPEGREMVEYVIDI
jgi:GNAT superfamily N-acetyltransferase